MTKFRSEKNTGWEGGYRVPQLVRWPGKVKAGSISNEIMSHLDWLPTLVAAAGEPNVKEKLLKGYQANGKTYKVHLDGYNFLPHLTGQEKEGPRKEFFYFSDEGDLMALRYKNWKVHFMVQDQEGTLEIWQRGFRGLRMPYIFNLRTDPYEQATITSNTYWDWYIDHAWVLYPLGDVVGEFLGTFKEFPPRMKAGWPSSTCTRWSTSSSTCRSARPSPRAALSDATGRPACSRQRSSPKSTPAAA